MVAAAIQAILGTMPAHAVAPAPSYADLSLEELANVVITSVARRPQALASAPASVFVITGDDLRRAGVATLPEALRLAPNLHVAAIDAREYAISARGFTSIIANKLLVLVDGRTVYSPLFSGVFWDAQDVVLADVERIEVISGPGGVTWGTNAVNGVINVITKSAGETQGALGIALAGDRERGLVARYGFAGGSDAHVRVYAKGFQRDGSRPVDGSPATDRWDRGQAGFRADGAAGRDAWTLQGDAYRGRSETRPVYGAVDVSGGNLLGRWSRRVNDRVDFDVQGYVDRADRTDRFLLQDRVTLVDLEAKLRWLAGEHRWLFGADARRGDDRSDPGVFFAFVPPSRTQRWLSMYAQDEIALSSRTQLTLGVRFERNPYTGWESLPNARLAFNLTPRDLLWTSVSRAVRSPARLDREIVFPPAPPYALAGGPDFVSELATTVEAGVRAQPLAALGLSATLFQTEYRRLRSAQLDAQGVVTIANGIEGRVRGLEATAQWQAMRGWRLTAGGVWLDKQLHLTAGSNDPNGPAPLGNDPRQQWSVRSIHSMPGSLEFEAAVRHVGALPEPAVPAYTAVDLRLAWQARPSLELSAVVRNAFDPWHLEFRNDPFTSEIPRSFALNLRWEPR
ncbi:MAG TPA: TonB-dependent receptor [Caldimonas sp.]|nr:TonB-dependent receptor [Caldimonas sp.]